MELVVPPASVHSLPSELITEIVHYVDDIQTINSFTRTCKKYSKEHPVDALLLENERVRITLRSLQHAKTMLHSIHLPNKALFAQMVADKKYFNNRERIEN